ncbi:zinc finger protein 235 [Culex quinquefasciatus]|uniref:Zinc finger protein 235 n=1 Tax=Culex quinquefasciatus TaxID=7176 RepID=B0W1W5_CULQU|nr:zinc finger protein 235 [Culex quinquefasciatus]|eukprot:XP_001842699.1 zinc finger protein 235 [Culex quinquefasciatus]
MASEDVDEIKQEPPSEEPETDVIRKEETKIKAEALDESEEESNYSACLERDEGDSGDLDSDRMSTKRRSLKRKSNGKQVPIEIRLARSEKRFACHCGMTYRKESLLIQHKHICDIPEDIAESTCRFCQLLFTDYSNLLDHVRQLHGPGMPETKCSFCSEWFTNVSSLVIHELRHQQSNVLKCDQCNRIFRQQTNLQRHLKEHQNKVEIFACDDCGKTFTLSINLEIHRRTHSGTRPSLCDLCSKCFYCPSSLRLHRLTHYKKHLQETTKTLTLFWIPMEESRQFSKLVQMTSIRCGFYCPSSLRLHRLTHYKKHLQETTKVSGKTACGENESNIIKFAGKKEF